jgi:branched-chain amino acid transport system ATP-binding protein
MSEGLLRVEDLTREFGGLRAVADLNFAIEAGAIHSIIGPNGAGKTTLFNLVTGVYQPTRGQIFFDGQDVSALSPTERARRGIARTFQNLQIFFNMSAVENVMVGRHLHTNTRLLPSLLRWPSIVRSGRAAREKAAELMCLVGLEQYVGAETTAMPYGALKRLEIARALAIEPKLLLLDEPAAGLNPKETDEIDVLIQAISRAGTTVVLVEHDMRLVMGVSDHILVLVYGRLLAEGTAAEIRSNPEVIESYLGGAKPHAA